MATCGRLQHIFEKKKPLPETPTFLIDSLSSPWNQNNITNSPIDNHSFTEIFGELHFKETSGGSSSSSSSSTTTTSFACQTDQAKEKLAFGSQSDYLPTKQFMSSSESLQLCTEGLGFESSDDVEELKNDDVWTNQNHEEKGKERSSTQQGKVCREYKRRSRLLGGGQDFPPPISSIGKSGKPGVCFRSFRCDGRFVLKEIRIPTQEFLHARREDGRLRLQFFQSEDDDDDDDDDDEGDMEEEDHEEKIDQEELVEDHEIENGINVEEKKVDIC